MIDQSIIERIEAIERKLTPPKESSPTIGFGRRLLRLREDAGLTQAGLIARVGISKGFMSELENGKRMPSAQTLYRLARQLGVSMDYLWTGE
jgi:DNA-binding XRE family transcriptional regulator